ncbi:hypothetical protein HJFPF1_10375 [Paramyrothecium foliicola]|nr:hypothetical protein HJFPF1_10375 [Paramyrothecium foliicola]
MVHLDLPHYPPPGFHVREATLDDVDDITELWFASFNKSHTFFDYATPKDEDTRKWLSQVFTIGILAGPSKFLTFVVEDLSRDKTLVAFGRHHPLQPDGSQEIPFPAFPASWDAELVDLLWGGMARNRAAIMGKSLHWMGEFVGVDPAYETKGLASTLLDWGCRQADALGVEFYIDATEVGLPIYRKLFGFEAYKRLPLPVRPDTYGTYNVVAMVRPPMRIRSVL